MNIEAFLLQHDVCILTLRNPASQRLQESGEQKLSNEQLGFEGHVEVVMTTLAVTVTQPLMIVSHPVTQDATRSCGAGACLY
jgi:hypothetical protein